MIIEPLSSVNRRPAHAFLKAVAGATDTVAVRPLTQFRKASGVVAYAPDGSICGLSCIYATTLSNIYESGSSAAIQVEGLKGIGRTVLTAAVDNHFRSPLGSGSKVVADIFADNIAIKKIVMDLGFEILPIPEYQQKTREAKLSPEQLSRPFHYIELTEQAYMARQAFGLKAA